VLYITFFSQNETITSDNRMRLNIFGLNNIVTKVAKKFHLVMETVVICIYPTTDD